MERLTDHENEHYNQPGCNSCSDYRWRSCKESGEIDDCIQRLTWLRLLDIEDILGDDYDLYRLRELVQSDRDGRCVVLPCKNWLELVFGEQEVFFALDDSYEEEKIREITVRNEERFTWYNGWETVMFNGTDENGLDYEFYPADIGDTVFLTREAAEAALKGDQHGKDL